MSKYTDRKSVEAEVIHDFCSRRVAKGATATQRASAEMCFITFSNACASFSLSLCICVGWKKLRGAGSLPTNSGAVARREENKNALSPSECVAATTTACNLGGGGVGVAPSHPKPRLYSLYFTPLGWPADKPTD